MFFIGDILKSYKVYPVTFYLWGFKSQRKYASPNGDFIIKTV